MQTIIDFTWQHPDPKYPIAHVVMEYLGKNTINDLDKYSLSFGVDNRVTWINLRHWEFRIMDDFINFMNVPHGGELKKNEKGPFTELKTKWEEYKKDRRLT